MIWVHPTGGNDKWRAFVNTVTNFHVTKKTRGISRLFDKLFASQVWLSSLSFAGITVKEYTSCYTSSDDASTVPTFGVPRTDCSPHVTLNSNTVTTFTTSHNAETKKQPPWNHHLTNHVFNPSRSSPQQFSLPSAISKPQITLWCLQTKFKLLLLSTSRLNIFTVFFSPVLYNPFP